MQLNLAFNFSKDQFIGSRRAAQFKAKLGKLDKFTTIYFKRVESGFLDTHSYSIQ